MVGGFESARSTAPSLRAIRSGRPGSGSARHRPCGAANAEFPGIWRVLHEPHFTPQLQPDHRRSVVPRTGRKELREERHWHHRCVAPQVGWRCSEGSATDSHEGLRVSSLCRGGGFSAPTAEERKERIADNRVAIEQAAALGAPVLVIVSGPPNGQTLNDARAAVLDGLREVLPDAEKAGISLGIEPLHPMYTAERSVVVTLKQANDMVEQLASRGARGS